MNLVKCAAPQPPPPPRLPTNRSPLKQSMEARLSPGHHPIEGGWGGGSVRAFCGLAAAPQDWSGDEALSDSGVPQVTADVACRRSRPRLTNALGLPNHFHLEQE